MVRKRNLSQLERSMVVDAIQVEHSVSETVERLISVDLRCHSWPMAFDGKCSVWLWSLNNHHQKCPARIVYSNGQATFVQIASTLNAGSTSNLSSFKCFFSLHAIWEQKNNQVALLTLQYRSQCLTWTLNVANWTLSVFGVVRSVTVLVVSSW